MQKKPILPSEKKKKIKRLPVSKELAGFSFPPKIVDKKVAEQYQKRKVALIDKKQLRNLGKNPVEQFFPSTIHF